MKLYHHPLSGHAHRAHLFLSLAGMAHELIPVDLAHAAHKQPEFLQRNAFGEIPVLDDNGIIIADSNAILVYIARKTGPSHWLPQDLATEAEVQRWLSVAAGKIAYGACAARLITVFGASFDSREVISRAHATLEVIEQTLSDKRWIAGTQESRPSPISRSTATSPGRPKGTSISRAIRISRHGCVRSRRCPASSPSNARPPGSMPDLSRPLCPLSLKRPS